MSGTCPGVAIKKERERERESDRRFCSPTIAAIPRLTWLVGAQWDVKYLNNGFIMRSSARRVHGGANGYDIFAISYEKKCEKCTILWEYEKSLSF